MDKISHQMESIGLRMGTGCDAITPLAAQHISLPSPDTPSNTSQYVSLHVLPSGKGIAKPHRLHYANGPIAIAPWGMRDQSECEIKSLGPVRRRISRACDQCNQLRTKCDGKAPCAHCMGKSYRVSSVNARTHLAPDLSSLNRQLLRL